MGNADECCTRLSSFHWYYSQWVFHHSMIVITFYQLGDLRCSNILVSFHKLHLDLLLVNIQIWYQIIWFWCVHAWRWKRKSWIILLHQKGCVSGWRIKCILWQEFWFEVCVCQLLYLNDNRLFGIVLAKLLLFGNYVEDDLLDFRTDRITRKLDPIKSCSYLPYMDLVDL